MEVTDKEIVKLLSQNNETVFKIVFKAYFKKLIYFAMEYVYDRNEAESIVQNCFLTLWEKRTTLTNDTNINAYLYTVTKNYCLKYLRKQKTINKYNKEKQSMLFDTEMNLYSLKSLDTSELTFIELEKRLTSATQNLPPRCRKIFEMSRYENLKNREIAEKLNITIKSVEANITRSLKVLRIALKDYLPLIAYLFN